MQDCEEKKKNKINDFVEMPSYWSAVGSSYSMHQNRITSAAFLSRNTGLKITTETAEDKLTIQTVETGCVHQNNGSCSLLHQVMMEFTSALTPGLCFCSDWCCHSSNYTYICYIILKNVSKEGEVLYVNNRRRSFTHLRFSQQAERKFQDLQSNFPGKVFTPGLTKVSHLQAI